MMTDKLCVEYVPAEGERDDDRLRLIVEGPPYEMPVSRWPAFKARIDNLIERNAKR